MNYDSLGQAYLSTTDLIELLYQNPNLKFDQFLVSSPDQYNQSVESLHCDFVKLKKYQAQSMSLDEFDTQNQNQWFVPEEYKHLDIASWVLAQCRNEQEFQRVGQELLLFQEKNLFPLLCYLKYLVDTMRQHNVVWGVGRGSSVASYVLYLIGVHKINSLYYDLPIEEFLK